MSNYRYTTDLTQDVLFRAGEPTDSTSDYDSTIVTYINRVYRAILQGGQELVGDVNENWVWLSVTGVLTLVPAIKAGTVTLTKGSTAVTFSSVPVDPLGAAVSTVGYYLRIPEHADTYKISAHVSGQPTATLDGMHTGETRTGSYELFKLDYALEADTLRLMGPIYGRSSSQAFPYTPGKMSVVDQVAFRELYPVECITEGTPSAACQIREQRVRFNAYPSTLMRVEYDYLRFPGDLQATAQEEPDIPLKDRRILADGALAFLFADKNDDRAEGLFTAVANHLKAMANENKARLVSTDRTFGKFYPRMDKIRSLARGRRIY
jgi:hypothetical protein